MKEIERDEVILFELGKYMLYATLVLFPGGLHAWIRRSLQPRIHVLLPLSKERLDAAGK